MSSRRRDLLQAMGALDITMTTVAPLRLPQLPLHEFDAAGVRFAFGTDGIRDLWSPYGTGDLLGIAWQYARSSSLVRDEDLRRVVEIATRDGGRFAGLGVHDLVAGVRADIVLWMPRTRWTRSCGLRRANSCSARAGVALRGVGAVTRRRRGARAVRARAPRSRHRRRRPCERTPTPSRARAGSIDGGRCASARRRISSSTAACRSASRAASASSTAAAREPADAVSGRGRSRGAHRCRSPLSGTSCSGCRARLRGIRRLHDRACADVRHAPHGERLPPRRRRRRPTASAASRSRRRRIRPTPRRATATRARAP